jgi:ParB family chromosome partitioning protein
MATYEKNKLYQVPLAELQPDPSQPRKYMDPVTLEELTASIRQMGIIEPVVCRQDPETSLVYVVAGERRCAAARKAGLATVPAIFIDGANCAEVALVENLLRQDLNPVEEAEALKRLMDDHAYEQEQLAAIIGKSQPTISKSLSLNRLPREIRDECRQDPTVSRNVLIEIARKKQERSMLTQFRKFREQQAKEAARDPRGGDRKWHRHLGEQDLRP